MRPKRTPEDSEAKRNGRKAPVFELVQELTSPDFKNRDCLSNRQAADCGWQGDLWGSGGLSETGRNNYCDELVLLILTLV